MNTSNKHMNDMKEMTLENGAPQGDDGTAWLLHKDFLRFVRRKCEYMLDISTWSRNIDNFSGQLKQWSKEAFGCLWRMKASLKEKLDRIDAKRGSSVNTYINLEYKRIWRKYKQGKVVFVGDRNTKYFHGFTTIRWRMNRHGMLKDGKGNWVSDPEELERIPFVVSHAFPEFGEEVREEIRRMSSFEEVFWTVKHMGSLKALGLNVSRLKKRWCEKLLMNMLSKADWLSEPHSLSKATNLLSRCETLEDDKSEISVLSVQPARPARMLSLLALSVPKLTW
ncbi:hypothetical protein HKD37_01G001965 [Glycine soja]